jgi:hypothetical protein
LALKAIKIIWKTKGIIILMMFLYKSKDGSEKDFAINASNTYPKLMKTTIGMRSGVEAVLIDVINQKK